MKIRLSFIPYPERIYCVNERRLCQKENRVQGCNTLITYIGIIPNSCIM